MHHEELRKGGVVGRSAVSYGKGYMLPVDLLFSYGRGYVWSVDLLFSYGRGTAIETCMLASCPGAAPGLQLYCEPPGLQNGYESCGGTEIYGSLPAVLW